MLAHMLVPALAAIVLGGLIARLTRKVARMSQASDRVAASLAALTTSVEALIAKPTPADDTAAENAAADALDALKAKVDAAVTPPVA